MENARASYWGEYTNLQFTKHQLIREYLNGWFPKLGSWSGQILYIDTHAGRGRHETGHEGSPLVAVKTFLKHGYRDRILSKCEVKFVFVEVDEGNCAKLRTELKAIGDQPARVTYQIYYYSAT